MTVAVAHQISATTAKAMQQAVHEARLRGTDLAVLHVVDSIDADSTDAYRAGVADEVERAVGGDSGVTWELHLAAAGAANLGETVVRLASQVGADLLVIGARRRSPVGKAFLGSVTQTVLLEARLPVMVVKSG